MQQKLYGVNSQFTLVFDIEKLMQTDSNTTITEAQGKNKHNLS